MEERIGYFRVFDLFFYFKDCLNPYCSGRKNRMGAEFLSLVIFNGVLILIVVEERIGCQTLKILRYGKFKVLILIVVEERIGFANTIGIITFTNRLNPYCSGRKNRIPI